MKTPQQKSSRCHHAAYRLLRTALTFVAIGLFFEGNRAFAAPAPQEPQGEIIGTVEGQAIAVKGPMSVQVVGNEVKTLLRSGVDILVKSGRARITLTDGSTIAVCGPAHISMLKSGNALTIALDTGSIHARVAGNLTLNVFTAQILAKTVAIGDGPQDFLVGFDSPGLMCVRAGLGALRLEEQFGGQSVMVPQGGDITLGNGQLRNIHNNSGLCACEAYDSASSPAGAIGPEISALASSEEVRRDSTPRKPAAQTAANPRAPDLTKVPAVEPTYQVFMPPLRYDASAKVQDEPDPKLIVLVRRVRVRPTLIFQSRVQGDPLPSAQTSTQPSLSAAKSKQQPVAPKPSTAANSSVVDRVKTFFKSLWTPSS
jgi:hypothetical protein